MSANMNSFFDELVEAKRAMEKVPELEGQLAYHKSQHTYAESRNDDFRQEIDRKNAQLAELNAKIAKLEASLDIATFQGNEVRDRLEVLLSAVRGVVKEVSETVELVAPAPKAPAPEVVASADPTILSQASETTTTGPSVPTTGEGTSLSVDPTSAGGSEPTGVGPSAERPFSPGTLAESLPTSGRESVSLPTTGGSAATASAHQSSSPGDASSAEVSSNASGPFASSTDGESITAPVTSGSAQANELTAEMAAASPPNPRPHEGQPYWHKPAAMTWLEWAGLGGNRPNWVADGYYDSVR